MKHIKNILIVLLATLVFVPGALAAGLSFYHTDPSGTPVRMTDNTGKVVWHEVYKPFGEQQAIPTATKPNAKRFIGKELDPETGLQNVGVRYMHNSIGRFTSPDPVGAVDAMTGDTNTALLLNPQRLNAYTYGLNNPYRYIDPDGKIPIETIWDIGNVIYDIITWDKVSLGVDLAAMAIPYAPAGLTKLSKLGKGIDKVADVSKKAKARTSSPGDIIRTPDTHPEDFTRNNSGQYKNNNTGEVFEKSHTNHSQSDGGEWKVGTKKGQSPRKGDKITVGSDGTIIKKDG